MSADRASLVRDWSVFLRRLPACRHCSLFRPVEAAIFVQCMAGPSLTHDVPAPGPQGSIVLVFFFPVRTTYRDVSSMMCGAFFGAIGRYSAEILKGRIFHSPSEFGAPRCGSPEPGRKSRSRSLLLIHLRPGANVMTPPANVQFENQLGAIAQRTPAEPESTPALSPAGSCQGPQGDGR